jgi:hypothetical protein
MPRDSQNSDLKLRTTIQIRILLGAILTKLGLLGLGNSQREDQPRVPGHLKNCSKYLRRI